MLLYEIAYILAVIALAAINARIIKEGRKVWHFGNGLLHLTAAGFASAIWWWPMGIAILCNVRVFFDCALNYFRFGRINYISIKPASFVDRLELQLFGKEFYLVKLGYLVISLLLNMCYFVFVV